MLGLGEGGGEEVMVPCCEVGDRCLGRRRGVKDEVHRSGNWEEER